MAQETLKVRSGRKKTGIFVNCEICAKEFYIYPSRFKNKHNTCSKECMGKLASIRFSKKIEVPCSVCKTPISYKESHFKKIKNHTCSSACRGKLISTIYRGDENPNSLKLSEEDKWFRSRCLDYRIRAFGKGLDFNLDYLFLRELFKKQEGLCHYCNVPMEIQSKVGRINQAASFNVASLDRIDSNKGYTKDNVVWCLNCINMLKAHHDIKDIKQVMRSIFMKESESIDVGIKLLYSDSQAAFKSAFLDAGYDLYTHKIEDCGHYIKVYSGIAIEPKIGYFMFLAPRSSAHKYGLTLYNNLGIIDNNFRGEIVGMFLKTSNYKVPEIGTRLMQLIPQKQIQIKFIQVEELSNTERGAGGFGSSGR